MDPTEIIADSQKRLNKLLPLLNFFNHGHLVSISVRTKLIHQTFDENKELDIQKLELYHLQYTDTLINLLQKLKKTNEQKYQLIFSEISLNEEYIETYQREMSTDVFSRKSIEHNLFFQQFLSDYYQELAFAKQLQFIPDFAKLKALAQEFALNYFREISPEQFVALSQNPSPNYEFLGFEVEKKLLGRLNIQNFKVKFVCGFQSQNKYLQVYKFIHNNEHFLLHNEALRLISVDLEQFPGLDFSKNQSNKQLIVAQLFGRNQELKTQAEVALQNISPEINDLLKHYLAQISSIDLMQNLQSIDEQSNILKSMLNMRIE